MMINWAGVCNKPLMLLAFETITLFENFNAFLENFKELRAQCKVMGNGTLSPIIPDHFMREHSYFISKIKRYMQLEKENAER